MTTDIAIFRPSPLIRAMMLPGALFLLAFSVVVAVWAVTYLPNWAAALVGCLMLPLAGIAIASLIMASQLVLMRGPALVMDRSGANVTAYSTGPIPWHLIEGVDIVDGSAGGLRFRLKPELRLSRLARFLIAMNAGRGGIVISHSYLNAEPEAAMEAAQRLRAESPS